MNRLKENKTHFFFKDAFFVMFSQFTPLWTRKASHWVMSYQEKSFWNLNPSYCFILIFVRSKR